MAGRRVIKYFCRKRRLERRVIESKNLVSKTEVTLGFILSSTEHVKFCVNIAGPPAKAKYTNTPIAHSTVRER